MVHERPLKMAEKSTSMLLILLVVCSFCGKNFTSLGRHTWRCKSKHSQPSTGDNVTIGNDSQQNNSENQSGDQRNTSHSDEIPIPNVETIKCICGRKCKGLRGVRAHQRTCRTFNDLKNDLGEESRPNASVTHANELQPVLAEAPVTLGAPLLKPGVKLPTSNKEWETANAYFHSELPITQISGKNLDDVVNNFNNVVYEYFKSQNGTVKRDDLQDGELKVKYGNLSKNQLKKTLRDLKKETPVNERHLKYVSKLLRSKISDSKGDHVYSIDHDFEIKKNFWGYVKRFFETTAGTLPSFSRVTCNTYFQRSFRAFDAAKRFVIPEWIPKFLPPRHQFDMKPPTYREVCRIVKRTKAKGSPCPIDQISVICFKRCPYLRSYITTLYAEIFNTGHVPTPWKRAVTILIHKKDSTDNPENFRPITLENVTLKIFTSLLSDKIGNFLRINGYAEMNIQKGFVHGMSGTFEHTSHLSFIINEARNKQRSLIVTLLDLQNAFGEVNHNLIDRVLEYHYIPVEMKLLIRNVYTEFFTAITTREFTSDFIHVGKGVLQGDCLSPLLFNMVTNTFIQYIKCDKFVNLGYKYLKFLTPRHWYQFADDAAVISGTENESQILLSAFKRWCSWADMIIKVSKCHSFGIRKEGSISKQFKPKLYAGNDLIPPIEIGESFTYLGRHFDFGMSNTLHKEELQKEVDSKMRSIDELPLHPRNKLLLYQRFVLSKISWNLTIADLSITWVKLSLDSVVSRYIRKWLEIPISGTLDIISLSKSKFGIGFVNVSSRFTQCQSTIRRCLKTSVNSDIRRIFSETSNHTNLQYDGFESSVAAIKSIRNNKEAHIVNKLSTQSLVIEALWKSSLPASKTIWHKALNSLPRNIYSFCLRYLNNTLANGTNMHKWGRADTPLCPLCNSPQTLGHVMGGCKVMLDKGRYDWRHNSVLINLTHSINTTTGIDIYADIEGYRNPSIITGDNYRPDLIVTKVEPKEISVYELTVGFETNIDKNTENKANRYKELLVVLGNQYDKVTFVNLSMSAIGTYGKSCRNLKKSLQDLGQEETEIQYNMSKLTKVCIRTSYYVFCMRNKVWNNPELMVW